MIQEESLIFKNKQVSFIETNGQTIACRRIASSYNKVSWEHSHAPSFMAAFQTQRQNWLVMTEPYGPKSPKIFTTQPLEQKICKPWFRLSMLR